MLDVLETESFSSWLAGLRDAQARARIQARLIRLRLGNYGDVKPVGEGVSELRIDYGRTQKKDIKAAIHLARNLENE